MKKALAFLTASVMALGSLPFLSVGAEDAFAPGDVDMDGVLTGHDAALVSRHLVHGDNNLSEEQLKLADYNGDGVVDQTDVEAISANQVYCLGDIDLDGDMDIDDAFLAQQEYAYGAIGNNNPDLRLSQLQLNLADVSASPDTMTIFDDEFEILSYYSSYAAGCYYTLIQNEGKDVFMKLDGQKCYFYSCREAWKTPELHTRQTMTDEELDDFLNNTKEIIDNNLNKNR